eukprot:m.582544 g.582544  ORF g.582544 m.582544 type:complete len:792 (-) comp22337_c1_seq16:1784-4159(-)
MVSTMVAKTAMMVTFHTAVVLGSSSLFVDDSRADILPGVPGCYQDAGKIGNNQTGRQMTFQACEPCVQLSQESCAAMCKAKGFLLFGVEAGHQCYCDNSIHYPEKRLSGKSTCDLSCTGVDGKCNTGQKCGGDYQLWVGAVAAMGPPCQLPTVEPKESRNILNGTVMYNTGYLDQPYCQINPKTNEWTCITTAQSAHEGGPGEHLISQVSTDEGKTWSDPARLEPLAVGIDNSYGTLAIAETGRLYAMYNMNLDNITHLPDGTACTRTDELGHFVMRYSDDAGRTWSSSRYEVPYRLTPLDFNNSWDGKVKIMWNVDQVKTVAQQADSSQRWAVYGFTKIGHYVQNAPQELWFMASKNLLTETDASKVEWELLPTGDHGILPPGVSEGPPQDPEGDVLEEAHIVPLAQGGFYVVGRTTQGFLAATHTNASIEDGLTGWRSTGYATYWSVDAATSGHLVAIPPAQPLRSVGAPGYGLKNPRGPITPKRMHNGQYLLLFYNNAGGGFSQRDPYWLAAGVESATDGILWSQPEIVLYNRYTKTGTPAGGYPDFIQSETTGMIYITETNKDTSRIHQVDAQLLELLFGQREINTVADGAAASLRGHAGGTLPTPVPLPPVGAWTVPGQGFTIDVLFQTSADTSQVAGDVLVDTRLDEGAGVGVALLFGTNGSIVLNITDAQRGSVTDAVGRTLETDPTCAAALRHPGVHHVGVVVDAGPMIASFVVDGLVCDGGHNGAQWTSGWFWLPPVNTFSGGPASVGGAVLDGHIYTHALKHSQLIGNYRALKAREATAAH